MQIIIQSVRIAKTGTSKNGEWELIAVKSQKGTEYTTFDKKVKHLGTDSIIEIGEPEEKNGKLSFEKVVEIIKEVSPAEQSHPESNGRKRTYAEDVALEEMKRKSIESQKRAELITNLFIAGKIEETDLLVKKLKDWLLNIKVVEPPTQSAPASKTAAGDAQKMPNDETGAAQHFENVGAMFAKANLEGIGRSVILKHFGIKETDAAKIIPDDLWARIYEELIVPARKLAAELEGKK